MKVSFASTAFFCGLSAFACQTTAFANSATVVSALGNGSPITSAFLDNVGANVDFLDRSSRLALQYSKALQLRSFARGESQEAARLASALGTAGRETVAEGTASGPVVTGRSVAVDGVVPQKVGDTAANGRAPMGEGELDQLEASNGKSFDDLYWQTQLDALSQLESDYRTYIAHGDDASLVALSQRELPKVLRRLMALTKI